MTKQSIKFVAFPFDALKREHHPQRPSQSALDAAKVEVKQGRPPVEIEFNVDDKAFVVVCSRVLTPEEDAYVRDLAIQATKHNARDLRTPVLNLA